MEKTIDYRIKDESVRFEYFIKYFTWSLKFQDCDPALFLMNYIHDRMETNIEQRYWMAWLYGNTYNIATTWLLFNEFPDFENVDVERLRNWNALNYKKLHYQNDQKWQKGFLPEMFISYRDNVLKFGKTQGDFFKAICCEDEYTNFDNLYKYFIKNLYKFGRYSSWFYIQTLKETCDLNVSSNDLLLKDDNTHAQRDGLCYSIGEDDWVGDDKLHRDSDRLDILNEISILILEEMEKRCPELKCDMFLLETCLCAFKKTFRKKSGRYLGYYLDRQFEDIKQIEKDDWVGIDWQLLWDGRDEILDSRVNKETGVSTEDMEYFLNTGKIKYIEYLKE